MHEENSARDKCAVKKKKKRKPSVCRVYGMQAKGREGVSAGCLESCEGRQGIAPSKHR